MATPKAQAPKAAPASTKPMRAPVPKNAPAFFTAAMTKARKAGRPVVIDFWAEWCGPCKRLKKITMAEARVKTALESVELIFVDLDKHPELAKTFKVKSIPDVFFINAEGLVVDRLRKFEAAEPFLKRLQKLCKRPTPLPVKKSPR